MSEIATSFVVLKFGGTSVSTLQRWQTIAQVLAERVQEGHLPVVVCSALSGVTSALEDALDLALRGGDHEAAIETIKSRHLTLADDMGLERVDEGLLKAELESLKHLTLGASLVGEVTPRLKARVMSLGELMSTRLGAAYLQTQGFDARWFDAREALTSNVDLESPAERRYLSATCDEELDPELRERFHRAKSQVVITQGFIARDPQEGHSVLLGRGGSDTSAAYLSAKLGACRCEIWTDVPGMFTANPKLIPEARLLRGLGYNEAQEIATTGAKVLHPRCISPVRKAGIPLHIKCTLRPELEGTVVSLDYVSSQSQVKAVSAKTGITMVSMETVGMWQEVGFLARVFGTFQRLGLSIDLVSTSETNVTVSLDPTANSMDGPVLERLKEELAAHCRAKLIPNCAAVSLVGSRIRAMLYKLAPAFELFEEHSIHLVSQAASDLNLTVVVDEAQAERLVRELHWLLFKDTRTSTLLGPSWNSLFAPEGSVQGVSREARQLSPWWERQRPHLLELSQTHSPSFVYDEETLQRSVDTLQHIDAVSRVFYAIKANPNAEILKAFHGRGIGFECVSPGELNHVFAQFGDLSPDRVLFTPNFAPREEYELGFELGVRVTLDNLHPIEAWPDVFENREILVRIDPGKGRGHHDYVKTAGARSKFGISFEQLDRLEALVSRCGARVVGLHAHVGSGIRRPGGWAETAMYLSQLTDRFRHVRALNLGGGLGVVEKPGQSPLDVEEMAASLRKVRAVRPDLELWLEPGRFLVATAGVLLSRVTQLKSKGDIHYVGVDVGMNSLIRPALYGSYHRIVNLTRITEAATHVVNVVGPICESGDTLGYERHLPRCFEGDVVLIDTVGAYGRAMSSHYNLRDPGAECFIPVNASAT